MTKSGYENAVYKLSAVGVMYSMMTSSNGNIFPVTGHLCGEFTGPRWFLRTKASDAEFDVFFDLRLNERWSKQSWGWWFETLLCPLWRHRNANNVRICTCILLFNWVGTSNQFSHHVMGIKSLMPPSNSQASGMLHGHTLSLILYHIHETTVDGQPYLSALYRNIGTPRLLIFFCSSTKVCGI